MNLSDFKKSLDDPQPVYLLHAKQEYVRAKVLEFCLGQVDESARSFDWNTFDLSEDSIGDVIAVARTLPWMSSRRVMYVRNAEQGGKELKEYLGSPAQHALIVFEVGRKVKGWPRVPTITSDTKTPPAQWVVKQAQAEGYRMDRRAAEVLVEIVGDDFQRLQAELEKQFLYQMESKEITGDSVREMAFQAREHDVFGLIGAIASGRSQEAATILARLHDRGSSPHSIVAMLYWTYRRLLVANEMLARGVSFSQILRDLKIWSYRGQERRVRAMTRERLEDMLILLRETDALFKSSGIDAATHLERVVLQFCRRPVAGRRG